MKFLFFFLETFVKHAGDEAEQTQGENTGTLSLWETMLGQGIRFWYRARNVNYFIQYTKHFLCPMISCHYKYFNVLKPEKMSLLNQFACVSNVCMLQKFTIFSKKMAIC